MWRSICAVVLLPSLAAADSQTTPNLPSLDSRPAESTDIHQAKPVYRAYTFYKELRQGTAEDIAIQLNLTGFVTSPKSPIAGIVPLRLELQPAEGFTVDKIRYPKGSKRKFAFLTEPVRATNATWSPIEVKLRADRTVPIGRHTLIGRLTFQAFSDSKGLGQVEQVDVQIPITVVQEDARVSHDRWPIHKMPVAVIVLLIVLAPVLIAVAIPFYAICMLEGPRMCPD